MVPDLPAGISPAGDAVSALGGTGLGVNPRHYQTLDRQPLKILLAQSQGNVVPDMPPLGSALPVMLYKPLAAQDKAQTVANFKKYDAGVALPELPAAGSWVKLRNIGIVLVGGQIQVSILTIQAL